MGRADGPTIRPIAKPIVPTPAIIAGPQCDLFE
jgi:hypothetical protein